MILPLPFGRGAIVCLPPMHVSKPGRELAQFRLGAALTEAAQIAETLCRR